MPPLESGLGMDSMDLGHFEVILLRMLIAALLGAFLGYRLWRRLLPSTLPPARETAQAQTLIAIAGALMVVVIGQSTARAFGLVGLGGFIRFRSGIKDTRDAGGDVRDDRHRDGVRRWARCRWRSWRRCSPASCWRSSTWPPRAAAADEGHDPRERAQRRVGADPTRVPGRARDRAARHGDRSSPDGW